MSGLAILCPGQGGQYRAMFDRVLGHPAAETVLLEAAAVMGAHPQKIAGESLPERLFHNRIAQPLICAAELAVWAVLRPLIPQPTLFAGYSVGELAAYGCAAALSARDVMVLAQRRAALMDEAGRVPSGLVAMRGLNQQNIEALCGEFAAEIAIVNGNDHYVIGAGRDVMAALQQAAHSLGATAVRQLPVSLAAHTSRLSPASEEFGIVLQQSPIKNPEVPVLAGIDGMAVRDRATAIAKLAAQLSRPLNWAACMETAYESGCRVFLELGPGAALARMVRDAYPDVAVRSVDEFHSLEGVAGWVLRKMEQG